MLFKKKKIVLIIFLFVWFKWAMRNFFAITCYCDRHIFAFKSNRLFSTNNNLKLLPNIFKYIKCVGTHLIKLDTKNNQSNVNCLPSSYPPKTNPT